MPDGPASGDAARVVPMRGPRGSRRIGALLSPAEVARRLFALERQVEEALGGAPVDQGESLVESAADDLLSAYGQVSRWIAGEESPGTGIGSAALRALYRYWWRVDAVGLERVPRRGPVMVVANRASSLPPYDAFMIALALQGANPDRAVHPLVDDWLIRLPLAQRMLEALGALPATAGRARRVLGAGGAAIVFPEGKDALAKPSARHYRVSRFGRKKLLRVAVETGTPLVPIAVIGSEEVHPVLCRLDAVGRPLGLPALPLTAGFIPLPTKWTLYVGEPLEVADRLRPEDADDRDRMRVLRDQVRERLQALVSEGVRRRRGLFFG
jgi:1-acyl-sn-glycerol-3-phosphate acyltransferase